MEKNKTITDKELLEAYMIKLEESRRFNEIKKVLKSPKPTLDKIKEIVDA